MRSLTLGLLACGAAAALFSGCEAYVHTDAPANPPARIDVDVKPAPSRPSIDVDVNTKPSGGVDVNVNRNP
jgi:predicted component of type VI protein secretion system